MSDPRWPKYTWDARARQYRGDDGRFVPRTAVRVALDEFIDRAALRIEADARLLQAGRISLIDWQLRTEKNIKLIHTASAAIAAGGWAQATAKDWSAAANRIKAQYRYLERFARQIEDGLPLDGRFLTRAASYGTAGSGTYEKVLRGRDLASGLVIEERRRLHSLHPCPACILYADADWQPPGVLPDIGEDCECGSRCRCTFERRFAALSKLKFTPSDRAKDQGYRTVWADVARLDAGFQRDKGYAIGPHGTGAIPGRLAGFRDFLAKARRAGTAIEMPLVVVDAGGLVSFIDGRHRFAVLRDLGVTQIPVSVPAEQVDQARRLFGAR